MSRPDVAAQKYAIRVSGSLMRSAAMGMALAVALPAVLDSAMPSLGIDTAWAQGRSGDNRGGGNDNRGGGNDNRGGGNDNRGGGNDNRGGGNDNRGGGNDNRGGGNAFGNSNNGGGPPAWSNAGGRNGGPVGQGRGQGQDRYNTAMGASGDFTPPGQAGRDNDDGPGSFSRRIGEVAVELDEEATAALIENGWEGEEEPTASSPEFEFRNHGHRVSTFIEIAKAVGVRPSDAAMQANFGTPWENDLFLRPQDPDGSNNVINPNYYDGGGGEALNEEEQEPSLLESFFDDISDIKPGNGPSSGWETDLRLDVNEDGYVDLADLEMVRNPSEEPVEEDLEEDQTEEQVSE